MTFRITSSTDYTGYTSYRRAGRILWRFIPLLMFAVVAQGFLFVRYTSDRIQLLGLAGSLMLFLLLLTFRWLLTRGQVLLCSRLMIASLWLMYTFVGFVVESAELIAIMGYMIVLALSGILLNRRYAVGFMLLSFFSGLVLHLPVEPVPAVIPRVRAYDGEMITYLFNLLLLGMLIYLFLQELDQADQARTEAQERMKLAEKKRQEQQKARQRAETRLTKIVNTLPMVIYSVNHEGIVELCEGAGLNRLNLDPGKLVGKNVFKLYRDYPDVIHAVQEALTGRVVRYETRVKDRHFENHYQPIEQEDGTTHLFGISYDISDRHQMEQEVLTNTIRFQRLVSNLPETMLMVRAESGRIIFSNQDMLAGHLLPSANLKTLLHNHAVPEYLEAIEMQWESLLDTRRMQLPLIEYQLHSISGQSEWIRSRGIVLERDKETGEPELLLFALTVFTEERETETTARESRQQLEVIFNESLDVICLIGEDERIQRVNHTVQPVLGYDPDDIVGQHFSMLLPDADETDEIDYPDGSDFYEIVPINRADGDVCLMEMTATIVDWMDEFTILLTLRDVSQREEIRNRLIHVEQTRAEIEREHDRMKAREDIIFVIAHQLRNPLAVIQLSADFIRRYFTRMSPQQQQEQLEKILSQTAYLEKMMDNMLTARDALMDRLAINPELLSIDEICKPIFEQVKIARGTPSHVFVYENNARTELSMLDDTLLTYVVENLLSNAVKYSPDGGAVSMQIDEKDDFYIITVQDEGIGIPEASKGDVFGMFQRGENVKSLPGTGIGLGLAYNAIQAHGGDISFSSVEGKGSTFYVRVPVVLPDDFLPPPDSQTDDEN